MSNRKKAKATKRTHIPEEVSVIAAEKAEEAETGWPDDKDRVDDPAAFPLPNPKQERFAQEIASGTALHDAYLKAGYTGNPSNARRLRADEAVWKRIGALQAEIGRRVVEMTASEIAPLSYTRDDAMREANAVLKMAMSLGHSGPAAAAVKLRTEIAGMKIGEGAVPLDTVAGQGHVAKSLEDPQVVADILNVRAARKLMLAGGKDVEAREKKPA